MLKQPFNPTGTALGEEDCPMRNGHRAERADVALQAYRDFDHEGREPDEADVRDLLCDLQHYCHREGITFADEIRFAIGNFEDESGEMYHPPILAGESEVRS